MGDLLLEAVYQLHESGDFAGFGAHATGGLPEADALFGCGSLNVLHAACANAARGKVDDAQQGVVVVGVYGKAQIRQRVFDFLAFVEAQAAVYSIRYGSLKKLLLDDARLGVAAV